ncbi:MAG: AI-2E family transporter [Thermoanaerobaculia bacterium]|nr:AI-2E family transporter [Thermoanaerobaculia bacterium]
MITDQEIYRRRFLLLLAVAVSALFLFMIKGFLIALVLGAIFSGLAHPLYSWLLGKMPGKRSLASALTLVILLLAVGLPLAAFLGLVAANALDIGQVAVPWIKQNAAQPSVLEQRLMERLPILSYIEPYRESIVSSLGKVVERTGGFLFKSLSSLTGGTFHVMLNFFVLLYAMFFFLKGGRGLLDDLLAYLPLPDEDKRRLADRFVAVSRATIKGTLVVGFVQAALGGASFWVVGIQGVAFWSVLMFILSVLPGIGAALVWVPAVAYLLIIDRTGAAIGLAIWSAAVVGTVDNLLRPALVGKDTQIPDLLILIGTLGGLTLFGAAGLILGPIVVALFITIWEIYGGVFRDVLRSPRSPAPTEPGP